MFYTAAALTSPRSPGLLACGPSCRPKSLHASQGIWEGFRSYQLSPLPLPMNLSLNPHVPHSQRLRFKSWRAFQRGIMNQTLSRCLSLFLQPWISPEDRESFVLHEVSLQKGACEQSILPLSTKPHRFFFPPVLGIASVKSLSVYEGLSQKL